jgi:DNA-binding transcriptional LysR family regulator
VLELLAEAGAALAAAATELSGELRIGAFPTAVRTLLPSALVTLGAAHPKLELHVTELDPAQVPDALRSGALDLALVHEYDYVPGSVDPALSTEPILTEIVFLAAAELTGTVAECRDRPWIVASPGTLCHLMAIRLCQQAGYLPRIRHYADDFAAVLSLVAAGQGVALVPGLALPDRPPGVQLTALAARRRTLIACRSAAAAHPAVLAGAAALRTAATGYRAELAAAGLAPSGPERTKAG